MKKKNIKSLTYTETCFIRNNIDRHSISWVAEKLGRKRETIRKYIDQFPVLRNMVENRPKGFFAKCNKNALFAKGNLVQVKRYYPEPLYDLGVLVTQFKREIVKQTKAIAK